MFAIFLLQSTLNTAILLLRFKLFSTTLHIIYKLHKKNDLLFQETEQSGILEVCIKHNLDQTDDLFPSPNEKEKGRKKKGTKKEGIFLANRVT